MGATVDVISKGRLILGVGQGYRAEEFAGFGVPLSRRGPLLEESVRIIQRLWGGERAPYRGRFYNIPELTLTPKPLQKPRPPVWVAAKSEAAVRRAARVCDAYFMDPVTPLKVLKERVAAFKDELRRLGRDYGRLERPIFLEAYVAASDDEAWGAVLKPVTHIYHEYHRWGHMQDEEGRPVDPQKVSFEKFAPELRRRFVIGSPDTCIGEIERCARELEVNHIVLRVSLPGMERRRVLDAIRLFAEKVFPHFSGG